MPDIAAAVRPVAANLIYRVVAASDAESALLSAIVLPSVLKISDQVFVILLWSRF